MNRSNVLLFAWLAACSATAFAQTPRQEAPQRPAKSGLPPPTIDEPGVSPSAADARTADDSIEPAMPDTRAVRDKASRDRDEQVAAIRSQSDSVTRRQEGDDAVEEYREKGRLRMIRIVPRNGPEQFYLDGNNDGRLERDPRDGPVSPVYFTIYQWD